MYKTLIRTRWFGAVVLLPAIAVIAVACGSDPEPTATSVPTTAPEPTAASTPPTATSVPPTPAPTTLPPAPTEAPEPTAEPQAMATLEDIVVTPATTGKDLIDRISQEEADCIKGAIGEAFFGLMMQAPLLQAGADPAAAAPVFGCLTVDNILLFGIAMFDAQSGGWEPDTRACMIGVAREHPDVVLGALGMVAESTASDDHPYLVELYTCMTPEEKVAYLIGFQSTVDAASSAERDIINVIPESEAACIRESTTDEEYEMILSTTVHQAFELSDALATCITPEEGYVQIFLSITRATVGELSDESTDCLTEFGRAHPLYVGLVNPATHDPATMSTSELVEIAADGLRMYSCVSDDELRRMQEFGVSSFSQ